jgi:TonB family protein
MKNLFTIFLLLGSLSWSSVYAQDPLEPRFPGCDDASDYDCADMKMLQFIFSNIKHPDEAKAAGVSGVVVVKFNVAADGSLQSPSIVEGLGHGCDEEVIRIVGLMPKWLPATDEAGAAVDMEWEIEVKFK